MDSITNNLANLKVLVNRLMVEDGQLIVGPVPAGLEPPIDRTGGCRDRLTLDEAKVEILRLQRELF